MLYIDNELLARIHTGHIILTANERQTRFLVKEYANAVAKGLIDEPITPNVHSYRGWLQTSWKAFTHCIEDEHLPQLISSNQSQLVWEFVAERVTNFDTVLFKSLSAELAVSASRLVDEWNLDIEHDTRFNEHVDASMFKHWLTVYREHCRNNRWFDNNELANVIADIFSQRIIPAPTLIGLYHFAELTPQQQHLFDTVVRLGGQIETVKNAPINQSAIRVEADDHDNEILRAAHWAKNLISQDPNLKVGIVVPELERHADSIVRTFDHVLTPTSIMAPLGPMDKHYNISLGKPLIKQPVVHWALALLNMARGTLTTQEWINILRCPFIADANKEMLKRATLGQRLRASRRYELSIGELITLLQELDESEEDIGCPSLLDALIAFNDIRMTISEDLMTNECSGLFRSLLAALEWPGERKTTSTEYQSVKAFEAALNKFDALATVRAYSPLPSALVFLKRIAHETMFQPQSPATPIDILGVLEAEGLSFDHLWIMGVHDEAWPMTCKPNPLIPASVQKDRNIARSSPEREFKFAQLITDSLVASSSHVIVSFPSVIDDLNKRLSPLFLDLAQASIDVVQPGDDCHLYTRKQVGKAALEILHDNTAPMIPTGEIVEGGVSIIKHQAACPFRAFAEHRLGAAELETADFALSNAERGDLMHRSLELVWKSLRDQAALLSISDDEKALLVEASVVQALDEIAERKPSVVTGAYRELESERLTRLTNSWLLIDAQRAPFEKVVTEKRTIASIGGINFRVRIDRQDTLEDGSLAVIDYKSTAPSVSTWFGERPEEPQLPLYVAANQNGQQVGAVLFGQMKTGETAYKGIAQKEKVINPKSKAFDESREASHADQWDNIVPAWGGIINDLANDYRRGVADVNPKNKSTACKYCAMSSLCRVNEKESLARLQTDDMLIARTA